MFAAKPKAAKDERVREPTKPSYHMTSQIKSALPNLSSAIASYLDAIALRLKAMVVSVALRGAVDPGGDDDVSSDSAADGTSRSD